jgi:fructoselysine-6-P-deglycase FrlB-like protein
MNGTFMAAEMNEQPARLRQLIGRFDEIAERVKAMASAPLNGSTMVDRGSSDHAAVYGRVSKLALERVECLIARLSAYAMFKLANGEPTAGIVSFDTGQWEGPTV